LIPAKILTEKPSGELSAGLSASKLASEVSLSMLNDWEETLGFKYTTYPKKLSPFQ